tara:strand:+ start:75 stop:872 length:798 start_codon:yes stop_codon:yes gene_type:complete
MGRDRTSEKITLSTSVLNRKQERLETLKRRLDKALADRTNMSENYLSIGTKQKYQQLNDLIAKLSFEIMVMEGGTIKDNHIAEWINDNRWGYQDPYTGEVRDFKVGDRFNLDYGGREGLERKDWETPKEGLWGIGGRHQNWIADPNDFENFQTFEIEQIKNRIESLQISRPGSKGLYQLEGESDEMFALRQQDHADKVWVLNGEIINERDWKPGAEQMLRSDYLRSTDIDSHRSEHNIMTNSLIDSLKIRNNESKRDLSLTNGTQ